MAGSNGDGRGLKRESGSPRCISLQLHEVQSRMTRQDVRSVGISAAQFQFDKMSVYYSFQFKGFTCMKKLFCWSIRVHLDCPPKEWCSFNFTYFLKCFKPEFEHLTHLGKWTEYSYCWYGVEVMAPWLGWVCYCWISNSIEPNILLIPLPTYCWI